MSPTYLSRAITSGQWSLATKAAKNFPEQACAWSKREGFFDGKKPAQVLPLHEALVGSAPLSLIKVLVNIYPKALEKVESSFQRLPLHCACRKSASAEVIAYLVRKYKDACLVPDSLNRLPVHYALTNGANTDVLRIMLEARPQAAKGCDVVGWTPVHVAMSVGASKEIIEILLEHNPESVIIRTNKGTSVRSLVPSKVPHSDELLELANETRDKVHSNIRLPSLRQKSLRASRMILA